MEIKGIGIAALKGTTGFFKARILACALKKDMVKHTIMKEKGNQQPIAPITAVMNVQNVLLA
jgi:hypothetical protein